MNSILEVNNLRKSFKDFSLNDISFSLEEGCVTGFIGINGAGKTTTLKTILGLNTKESGTIRLFGKDMEKNESELKNRIGVVLDDGYLYDNLSLKDMKSIIAPAYSTWDESSFNSYINRFNLKLNQKISTLSKGMHMKFAIALALSHHADLLIMDEPTSGLDPLVRSELMDIILDFMKEENKSVFFSTHITSDLDKIADMIVLIDKGKIVLTGEKDMLLESHAIVKGDKTLLNESTRNLFLRIEETPYSFEGFTNNKNDVQKQMQKILIEKPTIEDIMLSYIGGR